MKNIYLHIGLHKTGTTTIQKGLFDSRKILKKHGYCYPKTGMVFLGQHNIPWKIKNHHLYDENLGDVNEMLNEIEASDCDNHIISSEVFSTFTYKDIVFLKEKMFNYNVRILIYFRRQAEWLQSMWGEMAKGHLGTKAAVNFDDWLENILNSSMSRYSTYIDFLGNYHAVAQNWSELYGKENVVIKIFEEEVKEKKLFLNFLEYCDVNSDRFKEPEVLNESLSEATLELIRSIRAGLQSVGVDEGLIDKIRYRVFEYAEYDSWNKVKLNKITSEKYEKIVVRYGEFNKKLACDFFQREPLFGHSYEDKSDNYELKDLSVGQLLDCFLHVLKSLRNDLLKNKIYDVLEFENIKYQMFRKILLERLEIGQINEVFKENILNICTHFFYLSNNTNITDGKFVNHYHYFLELHENCDYVSNENIFNSFNGLRNIECLDRSVLVCMFVYVLSMILPSMINNKDKSIVKPLVAPSMY